MTAKLLVIGGGLAGSAAAIHLARRGHGVILVERESEARHKVCGEFLSREALLYLRALGVQPQALGAVPITHVRLTGRSTPRSGALPFTAMSLTRRTLDETLLQRASAAGAEVLRGASVESLAQDGGGWTATLQNNNSLKFSEVFLATGKHDLRGHPRPAGKRPGMIAFKMYWRLDPIQASELERHVELILYRGGYAGLQLVEGGIANLCCLVHEKKFRRLGSRWENLLAAMQEQCPHLQRRLRGAATLLERPLAISAIPYGFVRKASEGLWQLGDQAAVIPSFTGDGMSIALHSGMLAAQMFHAGLSAQQFQQKLSRQVASQVRFATGISKLLVAAPRVCEFAAGLLPGAVNTIATHTRIKAQHLHL